MTPKVLQEELHIRPFKPIVIVLSSGDRYVIRHPELAVPAPQQLYIFEKPGVDGAADPVRVSYSHITAIETVPEQAA